MMPSPSSAEDTLAKKLRAIQTTRSRFYKLILFLAVLTSAIFLFTMLVKSVIRTRPNSGSPMDYELFGPYNYVVNTPNCHIPSYHPYREDIQSFDDSRKYSFGENPGSCGSLPLLSRISRSGEMHTLHLNKQYMSNYATTPEDVACCYSYLSSSAVLTREPNFGACKEFNDSVTLDPDFDFVRVTCGNDTPPVYHHFHSYVGIKRGVRVKMERQPPPGGKLWSVMIIGIDSLSRLNLMKMMPNTATYLQNSWFTLEGYSKVGDDTFSNIAAAVLAGSTEEQLRRTCLPENNSFVDWCPWIWGKYSVQGYITAYGEDIRKGDTFYLKTGGFKRRPTDYFLRTSLRAAAASMKHDLTSNITQNDCVGRSSAVKHVLNFSLEIAEVLKHNPTFSIFWLNSFSHDKMFGPKEMDQIFQVYLEKLTKCQDDTVLILMSDSGIPHGFYDQKHMSFVDTNLPFLYIWLPESFMHLNPKASANLIENRDKLTSHFDLHMTLLDLLEADSRAPGCPACTSLFKPIPPKRTCPEAGIPLLYCPCTEYSKVPYTSSIYRQLGEFLVNKLNVIIGQLQKDVVLQKFKCANFSLEETISVQRVLPKADGQIEIGSTTGNSTHQFYIISIETRPKALMDAVVLYKNNSMQIIDSVLRPDTKDSGTRCMNHLANVVVDVKSSFT